MPYIQTGTNCNISKEKEIAIKEKLGRAITLLGKSEDWLMVEFVPNCNLYFKGKDDEIFAYVDVKLYGRSNNEAYNSMTGAISEVLNTELGILPSNVYVSYSEFENFGWNGRNF